ncbi:MAG: MFS transporter [Candidatus Rokubacteria bacterium]|nr:MFS transporter [Candidatus Rokubacteria bacterium]
MGVASTRLATGQFALLWSAAFAFFLSFYLLLPTLPLYARALGIAESQIGLIIGCFALSSMVGKPWAGWAADRYGRRPLLVAGALIFLGSSLLYGWSRTAAALLLVRIFHGMGMGLYPTAATAMVADMAPPERRGEAMGFYGAASNVALAAGPFLGAWMAESTGFRALFGVSALVAALAVGLTLSLNETALEKRRVAFSLTGVLSRPALLPSGVLLCLMATYGVQVAFLPLYVQSRHAGNPGVFFLAFALVAAAVRGYAGLLSDWLGRAPVAAGGMLVTGLAMATLAVGGELPALVLAGALYGVGLGAAQPALMAWTVDRVPPAERGKAMGVFFTALELGIGIGAIGFGGVLSAAGFPVMFLLAGALALAGGGLALASVRR